MSQSATPATQNEARPHVKPPKVTPFAEFTIGTAIRPSRGLLRTVVDGGEQLRTVANGCELLQTVADGCEHKRNVERTHLQLLAPTVKREPLLRIREKNNLSGCMADIDIYRYIYRYRYIYIRSNGMSKCMSNYMLNCM